MTDFLDRLSARARGETPSLRPLIGSTYDPLTSGATARVEFDAQETEDVQTASSTITSHDARPEPGTPIRSVKRPESISELVMRPPAVVNSGTTPAHGPTRTSAHAPPDDTHTPADFDSTPRAAVEGRSERSVGTLLPLARTENLELLHHEVDAGDAEPAQPSRCEVASKPEPTDDASHVRMRTVARAKAEPRTERSVRTLGTLLPPTASQNLELLHIEASAPVTERADIERTLHNAFADRFGQGDRAVHVHVGKVDVHAAAPAAPPPPPPPRAAPTRRGPKLSLDAFLEQRDRGRR